MVAGHTRKLQSRKVFERGSATVIPETICRIALMAYPELGRMGGVHRWAFRTMSPVPVSERHFVVGV